MSRASCFSSPPLLGFDEIERLLDRVSKIAEGYPPYNVERIAADTDSPARLRTTLAVAGFGPDEIELSVEDQELLALGRQPRMPAAIACIWALRRANSSAPSSRLRDASQRRRS